MRPTYRTHRAVTPASQNPQIMHFAVHFQPGPGEDRNRVRRHVTYQERGKPPLSRRTW